MQLYGIHQDWFIILVVGSQYSNHTVQVVIDNVMRSVTSDLPQFVSNIQSGQFGKPDKDDKTGGKYVHFYPARHVYMGFTYIMFSHLGAAKVISEL